MFFYDTYFFYIRYNRSMYMSCPSCSHLIKAKRNIQNCVAGEDLSIYLGDLRIKDASLHFSNQDFNLTLVKRGSPVGNMHPEYMGRIQVTSNSFKVLNVNVSDVGNYTLCDHLNRIVRIISMNLVGKFLCKI